MMDEKEVERQMAGMMRTIRVSCEEIALLSSDCRRLREINAGWRQRCKVLEDALRRKVEAREHGEGFELITPNNNDKEATVIAGNSEL